MSSHKDEAAQQLQNMLKIGTPISLRRRKCGLRSYELAALTGIPASQMSKIENGLAVPNPEQTKRIKQAFLDAESELGRNVAAVVKAANALSPSQLRQLGEIVRPPKR